MNRDADMQGKASFSGNRSGMPPAPMGEASPLAGARIVVLVLLADILAIAAILGWFLHS